MKKIFKGIFIGMAIEAACNKGSGDYEGGSTTPPSFCASILMRNFKTLRST